MANPHFLKALLGGLSSHLQNSHMETAKRNAEEERADRSIFESMVKSDNPELQSLGLAGLMEKRGKGWFGKLRKSKVMPEVEAILQRANYASDVVPRGLDAAPPATPKPQPSAPPAGNAPTAQAATSPTEGGSMTMTPGVEAPPAPGYSMLDPTSSGGMPSDLEIQAGLSAPPSAPTVSAPPSYRDSVESRRREFHQQNPLGTFKLSPMEERQLQAQSLGLPEDEIRQRMTDELFPTSARASNAQSLEEIRQRGRMDLLNSKRGLELDEATAARLGVDAGTIDRDLYRELERNMRSADQIQARAANARLMRENINLRYFPTGAGGVMAVHPRTNEIVGAPTGAGSEDLQFSNSPNIANVTQEALSGMVSAYRRLNDVRPLLETVKTHGPILGRVTLAQAEKLGGMGIPKETMDLILRLQRMVADESFARGGKTLTPTELKVYSKYLPQMTDTVATALQKTESALAYLKEAYESRLAVMPERQRRQIPGSIDTALAPPPARPTTTTDRKIGDTKVFTTGPYAGKTGTWNGQGWEVQ